MEREPASSAQACAPPSRHSEHLLEARDAGPLPLARDAVTRLLEISLALSRTVTVEDVSRVVVEQAVPALGARAGMLAMLSADGMALEVLGAAGYPHEVVQRFSRVSMQDDLPLCEAVRRRETVHFGRADDHVKRYAQATGAHPSLATGAMVALPLLIDGEPIGGIGFHFHHELRIDDEARTLFRVLAGHCAQALDRARLIANERRNAAALRAAREEAELLYHLTDAIGQADSLEEAYARALDAVQSGLKADRASILLFDPDDVMRFKAWRGLSERYRRAVEGHSPWNRDTRSPQPIFIDDAEIDPSVSAYRATFREEGIRALAFVPLIHRQTLLGKFMMYYSSPRQFTAEEHRLATTIAGQISQSVARKASELEIKRLYGEAERSRQEAEDLARSRESFVAIVSHDLRNPLSAIVTAAALLQRLPESEHAGRTRRHADIIRRAASRMERLIHDLLDIAAIEAGALTVTPQPTEVSTLLEQVGELEAMVQERGLQLVIDPPGEPALVCCERDRVQQVFSNLVGNAVRFTPSGGTIRVSSRVVADGVEFSVTDTGPGIPEAQLPNLFRRFWRGRTSDREGVGLGLSIARGLVDAHGGQIRAENLARGGAAFSFTLPASIEGRTGAALCPPVDPT